VSRQRRSGKPHSASGQMRQVSSIYGVLREPSPTKPGDERSFDVNLLQISFP